MRREFLIIVLLTMLFGCNNQKEIKLPATDVGDPGDSEVNSEEDPSASASDSEQVVVLSTATLGSYLNCEYLSDRGNSSRGSIFCSLRSPEYPLMLPINQLGLIAKWSASSSDPDISIKQNEEFQDPLWQKHFQVEQKNGQGLEYSGIKLELELYSNEQFRVFRTSAVAKPSLSAWLKINGATVPAGAIAGGTEREGRDTLYLCRLYYKQAILPGKLLVPDNFPESSVCLSIFDGNSIFSQPLEDLNLLYQNEILVIQDSNLQFNDLYQWTPAANGVIPDNAVPVGLNLDGQTLYLCRALERGPPPDPELLGNSPEGEPTPGYIHAGRSNCIYEYYGARSQAIYEVLSFVQLENRQ